jgi:hypothetical protein
MKGQIETMSTATLDQVTTTCDTSNSRPVDAAWAQPPVPGVPVATQHNAVVDKLYHLYGQSRERERAAASIGSAPRWGIALVEAAIGNEWLLSGLNKVLNGHFTGGLTATLRGAMKNNPNGWWVTLTRNLVVPNVHLVGPLVPIGELLLALGFFMGAVLWLTNRPAGQWTRMLTFGVIGALAASALMTANFYLMSGNTLPGLDPANAFNEGLSIDGLLTMIAGGLIAGHALALRARGTVTTTEEASHMEAVKALTLRQAA